MVTVSSMKSNLPRASGGVSNINVAVLPVKSSSPRQLGCFSPDPILPRSNGIFTASAVVFPASSDPVCATIIRPSSSRGVSQIFPKYSLGTVFHSRTNADADLLAFLALA